MSYVDELKHIAEADDSIFPDFLWNPIMNDFEDNYFQESIIQEDEYASGAYQARKIRKKYNNYFEYIEAMTIYDEYMDKLLNKYGSFRVIRNLLKDGSLPDFVPQKPYLKDKKRNRRLLESGVVPSVKNESYDIDLLAVMREVMPNTFGEDMDESDRFKPLSKHDQKIANKITSRLNAKNRVATLYRDSSGGGTDFVIEHLNALQNGEKYDSRGRYGEVEYVSYTDALNEEAMEKYIPEELLEEMYDTNYTTIVGGKTLSSQELKRRELYQELAREGYDVTGSFTRNMSRKAAKMVRSAVGEYEPMTDKDIKKYKKRQRKEASRQREMMQRRVDTDKMLERTLLGNKMNLNHDNGNINIRLSDMYR